MAEAKTRVCLVGCLPAEDKAELPVVSGAADYVSACAALRDGVAEIWVRDRAVYAWLGHFAGIAGLDCVFVELTPKAVLAERWLVEAPAWLDDDTVLECDLLSWSTEGLTGGCFEDVILSRVFSSDVCTQELSAVEAAQVVEAVANPKPGVSAPCRALAARCLEVRCESWVSGGNGWAEGFCEGLRTNAAGLWRDLTLWALLGRYPPVLLEFAVALDRAALLRQMPLEGLAVMSLEPGGKCQAVAQIETFFKETAGQVTCLDDFRKIAQCLSGRIREEFVLVQRLMRDRQIPLEAMDIARLRELYGPCPGVSSVALHGLSKFVRPIKPELPLPADEMGVSEWQAWVLDAYMPYRWWQLQAGSLDEGVEGQVQTFCDWYVREYEGVHKEAGQSLVHALTARAEEIRASKLCVLLVVDCLPVPFWDLLSEALIGGGLHQRGVEYRFAPLPSETEMSKPLLLSGELDCGTTSYGAILQKRSQHEWDGRPVLYAGSIKELLSLERTDDSCVICLNWLECDDLLHRDVEDQGGVYEEEAGRLFARLADAVQNLVENWVRDPKEFRLFVVTDHGATRVLADEYRTFDSEVVAKVFPVEKHRFGLVESSAAKNIPDSLWALGYRFSDPFRATDVTYFIPRGHATVSARRAKGFVHGGATPEEVIVPFGEFALEKVAWKRPRVRFVDPRTDAAKTTLVFYVKRVVEVCVEIQNQNPQPLAITKVEVVAPNAEIKDLKISTVSANGRERMTVGCYFEKAAEAADALVLRVGCSIAGERDSVILRAPAEFRSMTQGGLKLKDL
jgi:hypothetical protein